jgi:O-antigen/teichoic acid export membrane protein
MILARYLGLSGMGQIACYSSTLMALSIFAELGTPRAVTILAAKSIGESKHLAVLPRLLWASLVAGFILWGVQIAIFSGAKLFGGIYFLPSSVTENILLPLVGVIPFLLLYANACGVFNGFRKMDYTLALGIIYNLSYLFLVSIPVVLGGKASGVVWSWLAVGAITGIVSVFFLRNFLIKERINRRPARPLAFKEILRLGIKLWGQGPFYYQYGVLLAISFQRPEAEVGLILVSFALINLSEIMFGPLEVVLTASVATVQSDALWAERVGDLQPALLRIAATLKLLALCLLAIAGKEILSLFYGEPFREAYPVLVMLGLVLYFDCVKYVTDPVLNASGKGHLVMVGEVTKIVLATLLAAFIAAKYEIFYVALSLFAASLIPMILKLFFVSKVVGQRLWRTLGQVALPWMAAIVILSRGMDLLSTILLLLIFLSWIYFLRRDLLDVISVLVEVIRRTVGLRPNS